MGPGSLDVIAGDGTMSVRALPAWDQIMSNVRLADIEFAVVDVETTGFDHQHADRVMEIAIVVMTVDGTVSREYTTLVNPHRIPHPRAALVNGIAERDTIDAPDFGEVAGDIVDGLKGRVVVAHNAPFDLGFIRAEFGRLGLELPEVAAVDTLHLTNLKLESACRVYGVQHVDAHSALGDARATASLLATLLRHSPFADAKDLVDLGCPLAPAPADRWPQIPASGIQHRRQTA